MGVIIDSINNIPPPNSSSEPNRVPEDSSDDDELLALMQGASESLEDSYKNVHTILVAAKAEEASESKGKEATEVAILARQGLNSLNQEELTKIPDEERPPSIPVNNNPDKPERFAAANNHQPILNSPPHKEQGDEAMKANREAIASLVKSGHREIRVRTDNLTNATKVENTKQKKMDHLQTTSEHLQATGEQLQPKIKKHKEFKSTLINVDQLIKGRIVTGTESTIDDIKKRHEQGAIGKIDIKNGFVKVMPERAAKMGPKITVEIDGKSVELEVKAFTEEELKQFEAELQEHYVIEQQIAAQTAKITQPKEETKSSEMYQPFTTHSVTAETRGRKRLAEPTEESNETSFVKLAKTSIDEQKRIWRLKLNSSEIMRLPPEIRLLTRSLTIEVIHDREEDLTTQLPSLLDKLHGTGCEIDMLNLPACQLKSLPPQIGKLTALTHLDLIANQLQDLPQELTQLTALDSLDLRGNALKTVPKVIHQLPTLKSLHLGENDIRELPLSLKPILNTRPYYFKWVKA